VDIVLIANGICTLANIIIVDPTHVNLISQVAYSWGMVITIATQAKFVSHWDRHPKDDFIPIAIEIFICLYQQADDFLHQCANMMWSTIGFGGPPLSIICSFYRQRVLVDLQRIQVTTILRWAIMAIGKTFSKLGVLLGFPPISLHNLSCAIGDGFKS
jgi:hypothetical protein